MTPQVISLSAAGSTAWIPVDYKQNPFYINLALVLSDTPSLTCKVEYTLDNVFDSSITPTAFTHTGLSSVSTNTTGSITYPVRAIRLTVSSWTSGTVTLTALQGVTNPQIYTTTGSGSLVYKFSNWPTNAGYLLASLVAGTTASRTSDVVTITATSHGVPANTSHDGFRFYYPGSASLTAGWYDTVISVPNANTITFSAPGPDFTSESVNAGAAWTTVTTFNSLIFPGGTLKDGSKISVPFVRTGDTTGTSKTLYISFGASTCGNAALTVNPNQIGKFSLQCIGTAKQFGVQSVLDGSSSSTPYILTKNILADQEIAIKGLLSAASAYLTLYSAYVEVIQ